MVPKSFSVYQNNDCLVLLCACLLLTCKPNLGFSRGRCICGAVVKNLPAMQETLVQSLSQEDPLEKEMGTDSSILAWGIPWAEEPGGLQSLGFQSHRTEWLSTLHCNLERAALANVTPQSNLFQEMTKIVHCFVFKKEREEEKKQVKKKGPSCFWWWHAYILVQCKILKKKKKFFLTNCQRWVQAQKIPTSS